MQQCEPVSPGTVEDTIVIAQGPSVTSINAVSYLYDRIGGVVHPELSWGPLLSRTTGNLRSPWLRTQ